MSSFSRNLPARDSRLPQTPGLKHGPNATSFISSGIPDLDNILGGGFQLGSLVMVMEDAEAPHHLLLLRNFMSQGLVHHHPLLYASPSKNPRSFLATLPAPVASKDEKAPKTETDKEKELRIAWQYRKYFGEQQNNVNHIDARKEYCNEFDLRKPLKRPLHGAKRIDCFSILESQNLADFREQCSAFLAQVPRNDKAIGCAGRIAIQSFCAPQCGYSDTEWDMLSFIRFLKCMLRSSNAVAMITFPSSLLSPSLSKRWQHMADTLLSVRAIPDEDKDLANLLTGYQEMVGLLHIHKVAQINTQDHEVEVEIHGETRKNEKIKKARILLRQLRTVELGTYDVPNDFEKICEPDHEPIAAWSVIEWDGSGFQLSSFDQNLDGGVGMVNMSPYKYGWSRFKTSTTTVWKSNLFFTGGLKPGLGRYYLNAVGSFDTKSQDWIKLPEMKQPRCYNTACTVGDNIYVFGSAYKPLKLLLPMASWGERFDIRFHQWFNLPEPPVSLYKVHHIRAYAVYYNTRAFYYPTKDKEVPGKVEENHNLILFPLPILSICDSSRICVFDCDTHTWLPDICPNVPPSEPIYPYGPCTRPLRHDRLAVVDGILFWHRCRKIYGYDLINQEYLSSLFQLPPEKQQGIDPNELYLYDDNLMFFINPGDHKLVIVFQIPRYEYTIHCYLFRVQTENPRIVRELYSNISTECMKRERLLDALLWCDEVPDLDGQPQARSQIV